MLLHPTAVRAGIGDDQTGHDSPYLPTEAPSHICGQPLLFVHLGEHPLRVVDAGLQLRDEQRAG